MLKKQLILVIATLVVSGCASTKAPDEYTNLTVTQNELQSAKWQQLQRFVARYPISAASSSIDGCATVEYVITPQNEIKDLRIVTASHRDFADVVKKVVLRWKWSALPKNIIAQPVKTQTRFEFCLDKPNQPCALNIPVHACPGEDVLYSIGSVVKR
ncbi:energy transducer TonB [Rheinheimera riviphila]|uniref:Energy transducer TonB n=1 Tax=Rheinheimera riviphila TaxID=1834037 RepID=A0A437QIZ5_9GAMM|nr:energy transducer TonB [Rheinheimera riviphila]RVU34463.1 energy transducer TonB [Rheinheimera riviphila]